MHVDRIGDAESGSVVQFGGTRWCQFVVRFISGNSNSKLRLEGRRRGHELWPALKRIKVGKWKNA